MKIEVVDTRRVSPEEEERIHRFVEFLLLPLLRRAFDDPNVARDTLVLAIIRIAQACGWGIAETRDMVAQGFGFAIAQLGSGGTT